MDIQTESELWEAITDSPHLRGWFKERLENRSKGGVPDAFLGAGTGKGHLWCELKVHTLTWRKGQLAFAVAAADKGERCITLLAKRGKFEIHDTQAHGLAKAFSKPAPLPVRIDARPDDALIWAMRRFHHEGVE
jgi:hypothetical protein